MTVLFVTCLIVGLLLGVRIMLLGVERPREQHPGGERSFRLSPAVLVAFLVVFGVTGYIVDKQTGAAAAAVAVAALFGLLAGGATARLVTKWWAAVPEHDVDDERYVLQGVLARVVTAIDDRGVGEVEFLVDADRRVLAARAISGEPLPAGLDVVIERVEAGVAFVETWAQVEQRL